MKRILTSIFSVLLLLGLITTTNVSAENTSRIPIIIDGESISLYTVNININGKNINTDMPAVNYKGNTLVPARIVSEKLGAKVTWDGPNSSAIIETSDKKIVIKKDSSKALVNGKEQSITGGAVVKLMRTEGSDSSSTMVPFRFIGEILGTEVDWDAKTSTAIIASHKIQEKPEQKLNKIKPITTNMKNGAKLPLSPQIHIEAESEISYKDVLSEDKLVIDISNVVLENNQKLDVNNEIITTIEMAKINSKDVRVTIGLKQPKKPEIIKEKNSLKINFINDLQEIVRQTINGKEAIVIKNAHVSTANTFTLSNPQRLVVDIRNTNLNNVGSQISTDIIKELRLGQYKGKEYDPTEQVARIVLDISEDYENPKYVTEERGNDLIIFVEGTKKAPVVTPPTPPVVQPPTNNNKPSTGQKTIVIDAGHGGSDGGAAANGIREKDVALKVSLKVEDKLKALGYKVLMTRTTDVYPSLAQRYKLANDNNADAFLSIHFNAATPTATGIETLWSKKNSGNKAFAQSIQNELIKNTNARDRGLKPRNDLAVLNGTKGISALAELGFITNPKDAQEIKTDSYLEKCANAIVNGIHNFFSK